MSIALVARNDRAGSALYRLLLLSLLSLGLCLAARPALAIDQWATGVIGYSSQYSAGSWSVNQAVGPPDTFDYGDISTAWTASAENGTQEYIEMGFDTPVHANGVTIRETYGNGFVYQIDALDTSNVLHTVWTGTDTSQQGAPVNFLATWTATSYLVKGIKVYVNTDHSTVWEEIDALQLHDPSTPPPANGPQWATGVIGFSSQYSPTRFSAEMALNNPNTLTYGDHDTAWTPAAENGTQEYLTVSFDSPVTSDGVLIRETDGNGFVTQIDALDTNNVLHTVWKGTDPSQPGQPVDFLALWGSSSYLTKGVKIYVNTDHDPGAYEEIDAVQLQQAGQDSQIWASNVIGFSSQYDTGGYSADEALGRPDLTSYGDQVGSWAPSSKNGTQEYLELGFTTALQSDGALIRETDGNGFVTKIDAVDLDGGLHTVWQGTDPTLPGSAASFQPTWTRTSYLVRGLKIYVNTDHDPDNYEEIDAVAMSGLPNINPVPAIATLGPNPALRGGPGFTLIVRGSGFLPSSAVTWNGAAKATTFVSPALLTVAISPADVATAGPVSVAVINPQPGGGTSNIVSLGVGPGMWGDMDGNGITNVADAGAVLRVWAGLSAPTNILPGDVAPVYPISSSGYGDRRIDMLDAISILRYLVGQ